MPSLFPETNIENVFSPSGYLKQQEEEPLTKGRLFDISADEAQLDSPTASLFRMHDMAEISRIAQGTETYEPAKANELYKKYGLNFNEPITKIEADYMARQKMREYQARQALARSEGDFMSGAASFGGSIFGSFMDPINIAASAIPITKLFPGMKAMHATGSAFNKMKLGFVDAAIGNAIVEPLAVGAATMDQRDYTVTDAMTNIFIGGLLGVGITGLGEGVRYLSRANKFNALATGLKEYSNSQIPTAKDGIIDTSPQASRFTFEDLVNLSDDMLQVNKSDAAEYRVQLKDDGPLGKLIGIGDDLQSAKQDLKQQYGVLLDNDILSKGYDTNTVATKIESTLFEHFPNLDSEDLTRMLDTLGPREDLLDFVYRETNGLKDLDTYVKNLKVKEGARAKTTVKRIARALEERIEDKVQEVAVRTEARKLLLQRSKRGSVKELLRMARGEEKELFTPEVRQQRLEELQTKRDKASGALEDLNAQMRQLEEDFALKQKQLDKTNKLARREKLKSEITDISRAINTLQNDITTARNLSNLDPEATLKSRQDRIGAMKSVLEDLQKDARTVDDIRNIIEGKKKPRHELNQPETVAEFNDYLSQAQETIEVESAEVTELANNIQRQVEDIKEDNIYSKLGAELEKEVNEINEEFDKVSKDLKKDYQDYLDCRIVEGISNAN